MEWLLIEKEKMTIISLLLCLEINLEIKIGFLALDHQQYCHVLINLGANLSALKLFMRDPHGSRTTHMPQ